MNEEFDIDALVTEEVKPEPKAQKGKKSAKISAKKQAMLDAIMSASEEDIDDMPAPVVGAIVLDENGKKKRRNVRIIIDEVAGIKDNFETVGVNGKIYQIKRGIPVEVPPEVVHVFELAQMTHVEQRKNPYNGELEEITRNFSSIPWRRA